MIVLNIKGKSQIRIKFFSYDASLLDTFLSSFISFLKDHKVSFSGPIMIPTKINRLTLLRSVFVNKKSKEHFAMHLHRRLIDIGVLPGLLSSISGLSIPSPITLKVERM